MARKKAWSGWGKPMQRVAGWDFDHRLNGYVTTAADRFACECGDEFDTPSGYRKCGSCGRAWNSYVIGTDGHGREASLERVICREIPVRKDVIVASKRRRTADGEGGDFGYAFDTPPKKRDKAELFADDESGTLGKVSRRRQATGFGYSDSDGGRNPGVGKPGYGDYMTQKAKEMGPGWWPGRVRDNFDSQVYGHPNLEYMHTDYSPLYARPDVVTRKDLIDKAPPIPGYYTEDETWEDFRKQNPAAASKSQFDRRMILPYDAIRQHRQNPDNGDGYPVSKAYPANPENMWKIPDYDAEEAERKQQYDEWEKRKSSTRRRAKDDGECTCWEGYERVPGTKPCAKGSCRKKAALRYVAWCRQVGRRPSPAGLRRFKVAERIVRHADRHNLRRKDLAELEAEQEPEEDVSIEHFSSRRTAASYEDWAREKGYKPGGPHDENERMHWHYDTGTGDPEDWEGVPKEWGEFNNWKPKKKAIRRRRAELFDITEEGETRKGKGKTDTPTMRKNPKDWTDRRQNGQYTKRWN